jgi:hypothetical protein
MYAHPIVGTSAALLTSLTTPTPASAATQATYYVSPDGSDSNSGTISAPFKTLQHARDVVRTVNEEFWTSTRLDANGNGYYKIKNVNSNKLLTVSSGGTQLVQSTDANADSQLWKVVNVE